MSTTVSDIIDLLGGPTVISTRLNLPPTTVSNWKVRGSIPARHHLALIHLSGGKITGDQMALAHAPRAAAEDAA
jgi:urease accessory protein UreH